jgi:hypothetical protein
MKIKIEFDTDNDAFHQNAYGLWRSPDVKSALKACKEFIGDHVYDLNEIGHQIEIGRGLFDSNGNRIGEIEINRGE